MTTMVMTTTSGQIRIAHPNSALPSRIACPLLAGIALVTLLIACAFALAGAWLILPFAGIEIAAFWLAVRHLQHHARNEERITLDATRIKVTRHISGLCRETTHHTEFARYWAHLRVEPPPDPGIAPTRLFIRSHGREAEIGTMLTEAQKQDLARQLKQQLGN